eukprot:maker-scaffold1672_size31643-snap-gene-0.7 protein:Tk11186 transcript:maker-scaffold1672_size31643-snap-gene-0.7-mRNA-1 annotation:"bcs-1 protein"
MRLFPHRRGSTLTVANSIVASDVDHPQDVCACSYIVVTPLAIANSAMVLANSAIPTIPEVLATSVVDSRHRHGPRCPPPSCGAPNAETSCPSRPVRLFGVHLGQCGLAPSVAHLGRCRLALPMAHPRTFAPVWPSWPNPGRESLFGPCCGPSQDVTFEPVQPPAVFSRSLLPCSAGYPPCSAGHASPPPPVDGRCDFLDTLEVVLLITIFALLALAAIVLADNPPPPYRPAPAPYQPEPKYKEPAQYQYAYAVKDEYSQLDFNANEEREGYATSGSYQVLLPDGRTQTVTYSVNGDSGYVADVQYAGEAKYEPYQPKPAHKYPLPTPHGQVCPASMSLRSMPWPCRRGEPSTVKMGRMARGTPSARFYGPLELAQRPALEIKHRQNELIDAWTTLLFPTLRFASSSLNFVHLVILPGYTEWCLIVPASLFTEGFLQNPIEIRKGVH